MPDPVDAVTVHDAALPDTPVIAGDPDRPVLTKVKLPAATPVTDSLKLTVQATLAAFDGVAPARTIPVTVGAVLPTVYTGPVTGAPCNAWFDESLIEPADDRFNPNEPLPDPVLALTV